jgi:hypothetical protein
MQHGIQNIFNMMLILFTVYIYLLIYQLINLFTMQYFPYFMYEKVKHDNGVILLILSDHCSRMYLFLSQVASGWWAVVCSPHFNQFFKHFSNSQKVTVTRGTGGIAPRINFSTIWM